MVIKKNMHHRQMLRKMIRFMCQNGCFDDGYGLTPRNPPLRCRELPMYAFFRFGNGMMKLLSVGWQWNFRLGSFSFILRAQMVPFSKLLI